MKKLNMRLAVTAIFSIFAFGLFLSGCDESSDKQASVKTRSKPVIGILLYRGDDLYISLVNESLREALGERAEIIIFQANQDQLIQNEQLDTLIAGKVDALAVNLVDTQAAATIVDQLKKAQIPAVFFNREPDLNVLRSYDKTRFVGTKTIEAGIIQGDIIARTWQQHPEYDWNGDGQLQYIMFQGNADNPEAIARTEYSVKRARELGVPMRQMGQTYVCNWDGNLAREAMQTALIMHPGEIELVISNNDSMALGAIEALNTQGLNLPGGGKDKFVPVVGVDAIPQAITAIENGSMSATVKQDGKAMGKTIADLLLNIMQDLDFLDGTPYKMDESGVAIRIPYSALAAED